jgi:sigma-B regulation protein RsbU (phosphoserine phosphatase)
MKGRRQISSIIFYALVAFFLVISVVSFGGALSWLNKPFPGFVVYEPPLVGSMSVRDWPGKLAGLKMMNRIVKVDGRPVRKGQDVLDAVSDKAPGTPVNYIVQANGQTREVTLPVIRFSLRDFLLVFFVTFLGGIILIVLSVIVQVLKPNTSISWAFFLLCFFLGGYMVTAFDVQSSYIFFRFHYVTLCFMAVPLFHLLLIFPEKKRIVQCFPKLEYLIYLPSLVLAVGWQVYLIKFPEMLGLKSLEAKIFSYPFLGTIARLFLIIFVLGAIVFVVHTTYRSASIMVRQRARIILLGISAAFLPAVFIMMTVSFGKIYFPYNFIVFFVLIFPTSIAYSIVRHNLFDADTIIRRTVGYAVVTAVVVGAYALVSVSFNVLMGQYQLAQSRAFPIVFTLGVILVFNPLRDRIQALVDRLFFRKEYDYGAIIDKIGSAITSLMDLGQILKRLTRTFIDDMFINTTSVMLLSADGSTYQVYLADGENNQDVEKIAIKRDEPLIEIIEKEKRELTKNDVLEDPKYRAVSQTCAANFEALHASLMVPLVFQDKVIGTLNLGEKKSGKFYNREDIDLLHAVSNQGAVAIENARLFQENLEKQRMEEELNIARELQNSMLPATCPRIDGFEIAASSAPAREVGGDFFDFIEIGENKVGLVVGDVTGKSVSGALVMSASRSVFRMLSEDKLSVGESMIRANRRLKKDIKSGMFVALLYVVLDGQDKSLNLCSAGQTQPVLLSARTVEASLVETEGDTFPLGILDDANYEETRLQLEAGDRVVFYTDGIVEAMNDKEEMYGFERLLEVIKGSQSRTAELLLKEILESVAEFAGEADQHDDLTAIVVRVME